MDDTFDAHATLTIFEAREEEERLQATGAELGMQTEARWASLEARLGGQRGKEKNRAAFNAMAEEGKGAGGGETPTARRQPSVSPGDSSGGGASSAGKPAVVKGAEDKLKRSLAATFASDDFYDGPVGGSGSKTSTQEKRAEAGKEAEVKAKDGSKQTKG